MRLSLFTTLLPALCLSTLPLHAEHWARGRGPAFNGTSPETGLPGDWSLEKGIKWKCPLPGPSGATPAVWGDSIFVSSPDADQNLCLLCVDRKDGQIRWNKKLVESANLTKGRGNSSSPSP